MLEKLPVCRKKSYQLTEKEELAATVEQERLTLIILA